MDEHSSLHAWLSSAGLGHLTAHFISLGVTEDSFPSLSLLDFDRLGVVDLPSRQRLFKLMQVVKVEHEREMAQKREREEALKKSIQRNTHIFGGLRDSSPSPSPTGSPHRASNPHSPTHRPSLGLKSFFERPAQKVSNQPTASPPPKALSQAILRGEREYLTLPLKREVFLSPARTFGEESPARKSSNSNNSLTHSRSNANNNSSNPSFQARPMSPSNRSLLSNLQNYLGASAAAVVNSSKPVVLSGGWTPNSAGAPPPPLAASPRTRPTGGSMPSSPKSSKPAVVPVSSPRGADYSAFHGRSIPSSPIHHPATIVHPSTSSPMSPKTTLALHQARAALERERIRKQAEYGASEEKDLTPARTGMAGDNSRSSLGQQSHHRALFHDDPPSSSVSSTAIRSSPASSPRSYQRQTSHPPETAFPRQTSHPPEPSFQRQSSLHPAEPAFQRQSSLHPLEPADFLADDAELDLLEEAEVEDEEAEDQSGEGEPEEEYQTEGASTTTQQQPSRSPLPPPAKILVAVRKRPLNSREKSRGEVDIVSVSTPSGLVVHEPKIRVDLTKFEASHSFRFDATFGEQTKNEEIYQKICRPMVDFVMTGRGGRASCFAYGQTGAGKTFTLMGPQGGKVEQSGLYVLAAKDIFETLRSRQRQESSSGPSGGPSREETKWVHCAIFVSFFELYSGKLFDLLHGRTKLVCRADALGVVHVVGLKERKCKDVSELMTLISEGNKVRSTGVTGANLDSSRSHAILSISLKQIVPISNSFVVTKGDQASNKKFRLQTRGKFSFIDLAGSERAADTTDNDRRTRLEGAEINKSLLALKECIRALDQGQLHTPFRGSILTQVLKGSFVGNSRTVMIANIGPNSGSCEHTLNSLRYADRVKQLKKGVAVPNPSASPPIGPSSLAPSASSGSKSARGSAGAETYMPHSVSAKNISLSKVSRLAAPGVGERESVSASPQRIQSARGGGGLKESSSMQQLHSSPSRPRAQAQNTRSSMPSVSSIQNDHVSPPPASTSSDPSIVHHELCARILVEEDALVSSHRASIDARMAAMKAEMELLRTFDSLGCSVDEYVKQLDGLLMGSAQGIGGLRDRIRSFDSHLREEEQLMASFKRKS